MCNQESGLGVVTNVMFMDMGEPFQNMNTKITAVEIMINGQGLHLSPLKVAISTSGVVPQIRTFCQTSDCALAVNSNATTDTVKDQIMCVNRKYNFMDPFDCVWEELVTPRPGEKLLMMLMSMVMSLYMRNDTSENLWLYFNLQEQRSTIHDKSE
ncbi:unnamed protein product [Sphagnum jensenii]|uniref:Uncharacterized protein n=2 Tax=Sphagnum jensenii TaxID=128206 RepID=A0ABP1A057_9BRYO